MQNQMTSIPFPKEGESTVIIDVNPLYRIPLTFVNLLVFIISCVVCVVCILALADRAETISFSNRSVLVNMMVNLEIPIILFFGVLLIISFIGFMGALRENLCMLSWYSCILNGLGCLTVALLFGFAGVTLVSRNSVRSLFTIDLITSYRDNPDFARLIDYAQTMFQCCGVTDERYRSWRHNIYFACSNSNPSKERCSVPASCCKPPDAQEPDLETRLQQRFCGRGVLRMTEQDASKRIHTIDCVNATVSHISSNVFLIAVTLVMVLVVFGTLRCLTQKTSAEIVELTKMYDKYYENKELLKAAELTEVGQLPEEPPEIAIQESAITRPDAYRTGRSELGVAGVPDELLLGPRPVFPRYSGPPQRR